MQGGASGPHGGGGARRGWVGGSKSSIETEGTKDRKHSEVADGDQGLGKRKRVPREEIQEKEAEAKEVVEEE